MTPCAMGDERLLLLAHGEIQGGEALLLRAHLAVCPGCRVRYRRLSVVTRSLSAAFVNPRLGPRFAPSGRLARPRWISVGLLSLVVSMLFLLISKEIAMAGPAYVPPYVPSATTASCRNDRDLAKEKRVAAASTAAQLPVATHCSKEAALTPNLSAPSHDK